MKIFRTYDIRGTYPDEINEKLFRKIGLYLGTQKLKTFAVGRDFRLSTHKLYSAFLSGLVDSGVNVIDVGIITSPMLSYFCSGKKIRGAMITASHNPKNYNGIKFIDENGVQLGYKEYLSNMEKLLNRIYRVYLKKIKTEKSLSEKKGIVIYHHLREDYVKYIDKHFKNKIKRNIKVVFDCSDGVASIPLIPLIRELKINSVIINKIPDGNFPHHEPNQTIKKNLEQLQKEVIRNQADLGIIFDGDADRVGFIDEKGEIVRIDTAFILLAKNIIEKTKIPKPKIIYDLRFGKNVSEFLEDNKINHEVLRVGNSFYKKKMHKEKNIILAGELSGHIMFSENRDIDDGIFAGLKMIEILSKESKRFSEIITEHTKYFSSGEISISVKNPKKILNVLKKNYKGKMKNIDGVSVETNRIWFNIRASNTEPLVRIVAEGHTKTEIESEIKKIKKIILDNDKN